MQSAFIKITSQQGRFKGYVKKFYTCRINRPRMGGLSLAEGCGCTVLYFYFLFYFPLTTQKDKTKKNNAVSTLEISNNLKTIT